MIGDPIGWLALVLAAYGLWMQRLDRQERTRRQLDVRAEVGTEPLPAGTDAYGDVVERGVPALRVSLVNRGQLTVPISDVLLLLGSTEAFSLQFDHGAYPGYEDRIEPGAAGTLRVEGKAVKRELGRLGRSGRVRARLAVVDNFGKRFHSPPFWIDVEAL